MATSSSEGVSDALLKKEIVFVTSQPEKFQEISRLLIEFHSTLSVSSFKQLQM
jgi:hypothetical protein